MTISPEFLDRCAAHKDASITVYAPGSRRTVELNLMATAFQGHIPPDIAQMCADPCSTILFGSLLNCRDAATAHERLERRKRRQDIEAMRAEEQQAKTSKPGKW